jgi:hypothetical protein
VTGNPNILRLGKSNRPYARQVTFTTYVGSQVAERAHPLNQHVFAARVPTAGGELARINLYAVGWGKVPLQRENEIVVEKFKYYP